MLAAVAVDQRERSVCVLIAVVMAGDHPATEVDRRAENLFGDVVRAHRVVVHVDPHEIAVERQLQLAAVDEMRRLLRV